MKQRIASVLTLVTCLGLAAVPARAEGPKAQVAKAQVEEAHKRYQRGRELYEENDFPGALAEIRRAYELAPNYKLLYDIAQICFQMQDYTCALKTFNRYLADGKADIAPQRKDEVQADIEKLEGRVAFLRITVNAPGAEIFVDGVSVGKAPMGEPVMVNAGRREVEASLAGSGTATKVVEIAGEETVSLSLELKAPGKDVILDGGSSGSEPDGAGAGKGKGRVPWIPWAITGGLAVGAGVVGGLALSSSSDLRTKLDTFGTSRADIDAARSKTGTLALTTDVLVGLTGAMAVTSAILTITSSAGEMKKARANSVRVEVGAGSVSLSGSF
jgi:hypothetical protein